MGYFSLIITRTLAPPKGFGLVAFLEHAGCTLIYCMRCIPHRLRPQQCDICKAQRKADEEGRKSDDKRCPCPDWRCPQCVAGS